jgi:preprotein translocase subunit SecE
MVKETAQNPGSLFNSVKWAVFVVLLLLGSYANYRYSEVALAIRLAIGLVGFAVLLLIALQTTQGHRFAGFAKSTRMELRKVVWPSRQETVQTTFLVIVMVIVTALILWGIDSCLMWAVSWLTGQRG